MWPASLSEGQQCKMRVMLQVAAVAVNVSINGRLANSARHKLNRSLTQLVAACLLACCNCGFAAAIRIIRNLQFHTNWNANKIFAANYFSFCCHFAKAQRSPLGNQMEQCGNFCLRVLIKSLECQAIALVLCTSSSFVPRKFTSAMTD